jgi:hypothetical protein
MGYDPMALTPVSTSRNTARAVVNDDQVKAASDAVGMHIAAAMDSGARGGEVVDIPRPRGGSPKSSL